MGLPCPRWVFVRLNDDDAVQTDPILAALSAISSFQVKSPGDRQRR